VEAGVWRWRNESAVLMSDSRSSRKAAAVLDLISVRAVPLSSSCLMSVADINDDALCELSKELRALSPNAMTLSLPAMHGLLCVWA